jgi:hypothetical protein
MELVPEVVSQRAFLMPKDKLFTVRFAARQMKKDDASLPHSANPSLWKKLQSKSH